MRFFISACSPDHDSARMTSSAVIMPRSPWLASAACTKNAGVPVEARVAAILRPTWPDLPMPVTMTRPRAVRIVSTAAANGAPSPLHIAAASAATPSPSVPSVRTAEAICGLVSALSALAALTFARLFTQLLLSPQQQHAKRRLYPGLNRAAYTAAHLDHAAKASAKARSPGGPFSTARMARPPLVYTSGMSNHS